MHYLIEEILEDRGIKGKERDEFLSFKPQITYDPFLLNDMKAGVDLIIYKIANGEKVCIYGDYDADGVTSVALIMDILTAISIYEGQISYYIPSRFDEGYGLNETAIKKLAERGINLIVTVDCGSVSCKEISLGKELGIDFVVTDHHAVGETLPECPTINPARKDSTYPFGFLAGVGVAFKLAQAIVSSLGLSRELLTRNLDLVAIGTIGDVVPLENENRTLVKYGMRTLKLGSRQGLKKLFDKLKINPSQIDSSTISYKIVPHINAAGRIDKASTAARLMMGGVDIDALSDSVINANLKRRELQHSIYEHCKALLYAQNEDKPFIFLRLENAHEGVTGIVAGNLKDDYGKVAIIVTQNEDGDYKGTSRAPDHVHLYNFLKNARHLYKSFGGHKAACGFVVAKENLDELMNVLLEAYKNIDFLENDSVNKVYEIKDNILQISTEIDILAPFGRANEEPIFSIECNIANWRFMGEADKFTKIIADKDGENIEILCFDEALAIKEHLEIGKTIRFIGNIANKRFNERTYIQMILKDFETVI